MTIYTHQHHIIPIHAGGTDDPDNLVELTVEEHAQAHLELYEEYGDVRDLIASRSLLGQMKNQTAIKLIQRLPKTESWKKKASERNTGKGNPMYGKKQSEKQKEAVRKANSVSKPYVSENMKRLHESGDTYKFNDDDNSSGGKATQSKNPKWYTDGEKNLYLTEDKEVPSGYHRGRTTGWKTHP